MSVSEDQIIRELSHYIHEHPAEQMALMPVYDAVSDHARHRTCTHDQRCPLVMTGAVIVDEWSRVLCLWHGNGYALAETEPESEDETLREAALRLLTEETGIRDVWVQPGDQQPFLVDVSRPGQHRYGPRLRVGFRYLFQAHSGAVHHALLEAGTAAWLPLAEIGIASVRSRVHHHLTAQT
ncbi:NUDIX domain-containing protein [Streptomyces sp. NPDC001443]